MIKYCLAKYCRLYKQMKNLQIDLDHVANIEDKMNIEARLEEMELVLDRTIVKIKEYKVKVHLLE